VDKMIDLRKLLFVGLVLALFLLPSFVLGDPRGGSNELEVQGAHVVSAGAYFRFLVVNHYSFPIYVSIVNGSEPVYGFGYPGNFSLSVNITESIYVLPNSSGSFDVIAPEVSFPCEKVTYTFIQALALPVSQHALYLMDYQVIVLNSGLVQVLSTSLDPSFQYIIIGIGLTFVVISLIIWQRKIHQGIRRHSRSIRLLSDVLLLFACCLFLVSVVEPFLTSSRLVSSWGQTPVVTGVNVDYWSYKAYVMNDQETLVFSNYWSTHYEYIPFFMTRIPIFLIVVFIMQILTIAVGVLSLGLRRGETRLISFVSSAIVISLMFFIHNELARYARINYDFGYWLTYPSMLLFLLAFTTCLIAPRRKKQKEKTTDSE